MEGLLPAAQALTAGGAVAALLWVVFNLTGESGVLVARWTYRAMEKRAIDAEARADRTLDLSEAAITHEETRSRESRKR